MRQTLDESLPAAPRDQPLEAFARAWDEAATGYDAYFVPRFASWVALAVDALDERLPPGDIVVPCCGTGPELVELAGRHRDRAIRGVDLSPKMIELARQRCAALPNISFEVGDASDTSRWGPCAAVLSVFGLQQMKTPGSVVRSWTSALIPGGSLSVMFWPGVVEWAGPFAWLRAALLDRVPADNSWEAILTTEIESAGASLVTDRMVAFAMRHESADAFWRACLDSGPGRSLALRGQAFLDEVHADFRSRASAGPLYHLPRARHLVARREQATTNA